MELAEFTAPGQVTLAGILRLQDAMVARAQETGEDVNELCPVTNHFAPGLYAREMLIPAGVTAVGKMHKHCHLAALIKGRLLIVSEFGREELVAPAVFMSREGIKRAAHALEDSVIVTFHPTEKTDLAEIEADVIVPECEVLERSKQEVLA